MEDRTEYRSKKGVAAWWQKDGAWHIALPYKPTDRDRRNFPVSYPEGDNGPFFSWTGDQHENKVAAIKAIEEHHKSFGGLI